MNIKIEYKYYNQFVCYTLHHIVCTLTMVQLTLYYKGLASFNSAGPVIEKHDGEHGGVTDGRRVSYSSIIREVETINDADVIVAEVNQALVAGGHEPLTRFLYNHQKYDVLKK